MQNNYLIIYIHECNQIYLHLLIKLYFTIKICINLNSDFINESLFGMWKVFIKIYWKTNSYF